ncbi:hypothetical protein [Treponema sp. OMZ 855]|uniref:dual OB domain-containing protein n=1 Tax=Treponema sp. OMZ 855 TaxID=1643512 RepID=UPI003531D28E
MLLYSSTTKTKEQYMFKTVLILANSIKHHGYCVAGKELITKNWIRFHLIF